MKKLLMLLIVTTFALPTFAGTTYITGHGQDSALCSAGPIAASCIRDVQARAEQAGVTDADLLCQSNQGQSQLYTGNCNSACTPTYIPPANGPTIVRCNAACTMQCEI
jgi:hypothetical protein